MLKNYFTLAYPFVSVYCLVFSFAMITLLVGADGRSAEDRSHGGSGAV